MAKYFKKKRQIVCSNIKTSMVNLIMEGSVKGEKARIYKITKCK